VGYYQAHQLMNSPFGQWRFSPWSIGCSVQDQYFAKIFSNAKKIKGIVMRMFCLNEFVSAKQVLKINLKNDKK
jgi:hypothetical protein